MTSDTRSLLIETATAQVRRQGYSAFSYADLAAAVGIRKPSIHHHFPAKEDLGVAMVEAYTESFLQQLGRIEAGGSDPAERLRAYSRLYREGLENGQGCLCGVLASETAVLPAKVQASVRQFLTLNIRWLEQALGGRSDAGMVLATLQGAMLIALGLADLPTFDRAVDNLLKGLIDAKH